jgi:hypothetical protein
MKPPPAPEAPTPAQQISGSTDTEEDAGPVPGMEEWKDTYDSYLKDWHAESSLARQKAEETRKKIEDEHAAIAKRMEDEKKSKQKEEAEKKRQKEREEKLKKELADEKAAGISRRRAERGGGGDDRDKKVKEAWEMIKGGGGQGKEDTVSVGDARGVTPQDVKAGNVQLAGDAKKMVNSVSLLYAHRLIKSNSHTRRLPAQTPPTHCHLLHETTLHLLLYLARPRLYQRLRRPGLRYPATHPPQKTSLPPDQGHQKTMKSHLQPETRKPGLNHLAFLLESLQNSTTPLRLNLPPSHSPCSPRHRICLFPKFLQSLVSTSCYRS